MCDTLELDCESFHLCLERRIYFRLLMIVLRFTCKLMGTSEPGGVCGWRYLNFKCWKNFKNDLNMNTLEASQVDKAKIFSLRWLILTNFRSFIKSQFKLFCPSRIIEMSVFKRMNLSHVFPKATNSHNHQINNFFRWILSKIIIPKLFSAFHWWS